MLTRRNLLKGAAAGVPIAMGSVARWPPIALAQTGTKTFVLAHGSWHGGWCWKKVADRLRAKGHAVYTPSYTGMGDRAHLLSKDITINTFAEDLVQVIQSEELSNVILVGHSFGGVPISGAADRVPEKIARLVYRTPYLSRADGARSLITRRQRRRRASRRLRKQPTAWQFLCRSSCLLYGAWERRAIRTTIGRAGDCLLIRCRHTRPRSRSRGRSATICREPTYTPRNHRIPCSRTPASLCGHGQGGNGSISQHLMIP